MISEDCSDEPGLDDPEKSERIAAARMSVVMHEIFAFQEFDVIARAVADALAKVIYCEAKAKDEALGAWQGDVHAIPRGMYFGTLLGELMCSLDEIQMNSLDEDDEV